MRELRLVMAAMRRAWWRVWGTPRQRAEDDRREDDGAITLTALYAQLARDAGRPSLEERLALHGDPVRAEWREILEGRARRRREAERAKLDETRQAVTADVLEMRRRA